MLVIKCFRVDTKQCSYANVENMVTNLRTESDCIYNIMCPAIIRYSLQSIRLLNYSSRFYSTVIFISRNFRSLKSLRYVTGEYLVLNCIRNVQISNLRPETGYPNKHFMIFFSLFKTNLVNQLKLSHDRKWFPFLRTKARGLTRLKFHIYSEEELRCPLLWARLSNTKIKGVVTQRRKRECTELRGNTSYPRNFSLLILYFIRRGVRKWLTWDSEHPSQTKRSRNRILCRLICSEDRK